MQTSTRATKATLHTKTNPRITFFKIGRRFMDWQELLLEIDSERFPLIEEILSDTQSLALTLSDAGDAPVLEPLPGETPLWSQLRVKALFETNVDRAKIEQSIHARLPDVFMQWREFKDEQWERVCLQHLTPKQFGQRLWIIPSNCEAPDPQACNINLDPGLAFGTGDHATTRLCLEWLEQADLKQKELLDYGHGSGILAIAARHLGAKNAVGIDIDPQALIAGRSNADINGVSSTTAFHTEDVDQQFDVVVANILAAPLISMAPKLSKYLNAGGAIALSGILEDQGTKVMQAFHPWIEWQSETCLDGWMLVSGTRTNESSE